MPEGCAPRKSFSTPKARRAGQALQRALPDREKMARPRRFERPTPAFGGQYSIQLSYGRKPRLYPTTGAVRVLRIAVRYAVR